MRTRLRFAFMSCRSGVLASMFLFLNEKLIERISLQEKGIGFRQLRNWVYWEDSFKKLLSCAMTHSTDLPPFGN
jgi:hypothetical protein